MILRKASRHIRRLVWLNWELIRAPVQKGIIPGVETGTAAKEKFTQTCPWDGIGCNQKCWESWLMSLKGCSLSSLEHHGDLGRYPVTGKKKSQKVNPRNYSSLHSLGKSWSCLTRNKSYRTNLISFCDKMTAFSDKGREVDVIYLNFSRVFNTDSHNTFVSSLRQYGLEWLGIRGDFIVIELSLNVTNMSKNI